MVQKSYILVKSVRLQAYLLTHKNNRPKKLNFSQKCNAICLPFYPKSHGPKNLNLSHNCEAIGFPF